ncbi:MAG: NAD(P)/FAD-dependent oxidoreductase [Blastocatellia bacterium]|nr:NAD(P)/FAD-dependent oxidoreductase [Blastocatellia bacterium]
MRFDAVIIGGGAAGLFCAIEAGKRGRRVAVLEHNASVGRKIIISGGGRCNFTNIHTTAENFVSQNPHFAKSALARYIPQHFIDLVKHHKIEFYEKKLGQLFCRQRSQQIVDMLLAECKSARVRIETGCSVNSVAKAAAEFVVSSSRGTFRSANLVVATGGLSFPKIGATDIGYKIARQFGLAIVAPEPSLVPLIFSEDRGLGKLAGISVDSRVTADGREFRENILFTHRGLSGPAILQASNYWRRGEPIIIDLSPAHNLRDLIRDDPNSRQRIDNFLKRTLPDRLAESMPKLGLPQKQMREMSGREIEDAAALVHNWSVRFKGTEGWDKAEVTRGGVSTDELSSQTMEAKKASGLYFIGEIVDVTGWLGGYNFQWAWASGYAAGIAL